MGQRPRGFWGWDNQPRINEINPLPTSTNCKGCEANEMPCEAGCNLLKNSPIPDHGSCQRHGPYPATKFIRRLRFSVMDHLYRISTATPLQIKYAVQKSHSAAKTTNPKNQTTNAFQLQNTKSQRGMNRVIR